MNRKECMLTKKRKHLVILLSRISAILFFLWVTCCTDSIWLVTMNFGKEMRKIISHHQRTSGDVFSLLSLLSLYVSSVPYLSTSFFNLMPINNLFYISSNKCSCWNIFQLHRQRSFESHTFLNCASFSW